ncbi:ThiF family adenylyltransferase [Candidatus Micrarchaeota archaeon]|nr:ThiF family adenylyltransferase [Candidatus Micrarchaeota archaeon]
MTDVFDRQKRIQGWSQEKISSKNVLVLGAGALGNEAVKLLVQLGVGKITIVDYDEIAEVNLNRCVFFSLEDVGKKKCFVLKEKAEKLNNSSEITAVDKRLEELSEEFFAGFDYCFSCLDNLAARIHLNAKCFGKIILIDGGTNAFNGKIQVVDKTACLECSLTKSDYKILWKKYSCVGEVLDFMSSKMPALATTTSVIASMQVNEFIKLVHGLPALVGKYAFFNGLKNEVVIYEVSQRRDCPLH